MDDTTVTLSASDLYFTSSGMNDSLQISDNLLLQNLLLKKRLEVPAWVKPMSLCMAIIASIFGIFGNLMVCQFFYNKRKKIATNLFILLLGISDTATCSVTIPFLPCFTYFASLSVTHPWFLSLQKLWSYGLMLSTYYSLFLLDAIAMDRHRAICHGLKTQLKYNRAKFIGTGGFIFCTVLTILTGILLEFNFKNPVMKISMAPQLVGIFIIIFSYSHIFLFLQNRKRRISPTEISSFAMQKRFQMPNQSKKPIQMLALITAVFFLAYLPIYTIALALNLRPYLLFTWIINHVANPIVYYAMNSGFKTHVKQKLRGPCQRQGPVNVTVNGEVIQINLQDAHSTSVTYSSPLTCCLKRSSPLSASSQETRQKSLSFVTQANNTNVKLNDRSGL